MKTIFLNTNKENLDNDLKKSGLPIFNMPMFSFVESFDNKAFFRAFFSYNKKLYPMNLCIKIDFNTTFSTDMTFSDILKNISNEKQKSKLVYFFNDNSENYIRKYEKICEIQEIDISFINNIIDIDIV